MIFEKPRVILGLAVVAIGILFILCGMLIRYPVFASPLMEGEPQEQTSDVRLVEQSCFKSEILRQEGALFGAKFSHVIESSSSDPADPSVPDSDCPT